MIELALTAIGFVVALYLAFMAFCGLVILVSLPGIILGYAGKLVLTILEQFGKVIIEVKAYVSLRF